MDIFDEILNKSPRDKFYEILKNSNLSSIENVFDDFFAEYIALMDLLEKNNLTYEDVKNYRFSNINKIEERKNDIFIELGAKILGQEG